MVKLITKDTPVTDSALKEIAHKPTKELLNITDIGFFEKLAPKDYMRIAFYLAEKSYLEDGCPIGGVIVRNDTKLIVGKGHNMLVQEGDPLIHGETAAIRDAGRIDFSRTSMYTTLSPCDRCASQLYMLQFNRVAVGDITNAHGNETRLRQKGIQVEIIQDRKCIELYARYRKEKPDLDLEDWMGVAALRGLRPKLG